MKLTTISPRTTVVTKYTAIFSLIERCLLIGVVSFPYVYYMLKCPLADASPTIRAAVAFCITSTTVLSGYFLIKHQNMLLQVVFPHAAKWKKLGCFILMLLLPIGELYFICNKIGTKTVYTYIQYPRILISPADVKLSIDAIEWWYFNDYSCYTPKLVSIGAKGLNTIASSINNKNSYFYALVDSNNLTMQINTKNGIYTTSFSFEEFNIKTIADENPTLELPNGWIWSGEPKTVQYTKEFANEHDADLDIITEDIITIITNYEKTINTKESLI